MRHDLASRRKQSTARKNNQKSNQKIITINDKTALRYCHEVGLHGMMSL